MCPPVENRLKVNPSLCALTAIDSNQPQILTQSRPLSIISVSVFFPLSLLGVHLSRNAFINTLNSSQTLQNAGLNYFC